MTSERHGCRVQLNSCGNFKPGLRRATLILYRPTTLPYGTVMCVVVGRREALIVAPIRRLFDGIRRRGGSSTRVRRTAGWQPRRSYGNVLPASEPCSRDRLAHLSTENLQYTRHLTTVYCTALLSHVCRSTISM